MATPTNRPYTGTLYRHGCKDHDRIYLQCLGCITDLKANGYITLEEAHAQVLLIQDAEITRVMRHSVTNIMSLVNRVTD